ncbi:hypothetical protein C8R46DRAFT_1215315 [Mycena filopes]|nr:hypothetical protein C8R46DRAFT_1215315 [Mycena filopes]
MISPSQRTNNTEGADGGPDSKTHIVGYIPLGLSTFALRGQHVAAVAHESYETRAVWKKFCFNTLRSALRTTAPATTRPATTSPSIRPNTGACPSGAIIHTPCPTYSRNGGLTWGRTIGQGAQTAVQLKLCCVGAASAPEPVAPKSSDGGTPPNAQTSALATAILPMRGNPFSHPPGSLSLPPSSAPGAAPTSTSVLAAHPPHTDLISHPLCGWGAALTSTSHSLSFTSPAFEPV